MEIYKCWNIKKGKVKTIPVIAEALRTISKGLKENLNLISKNLSMSVIQKIAMLGSAHILQLVLKSKDK